MARINVGVNPRFLADQHLVAESVEITMITGQLEKYNWSFKAAIPRLFPMGKGHMTFFKNKLLYLQKRINAVNSEMRRRGFNPGTSLDEAIAKAPSSLCRDWTPTKLIRDRIESRLFTRANGSSGKDFYRFERKTISNTYMFAKRMKESKLFHV